MPSTKRRGRSVKRAGVVGPRSKAGSNRPAPGGGGSGRGASARRRRLAAGEEATQHALAAAARATDEAKPDEALFFVDRGSGIGADTPRGKSKPVGCMAGECRRLDAAAGPALGCGPMQRPPCLLLPFSPFTHPFHCDGRGVPVQPRPARRPHGRKRRSRCAGLDQARSTRHEQWKRWQR